MLQQLTFLRTLGAVEVASRLERASQFERQLAEANETLFVRLNELARRPYCAATDGPRGSGYRARAR